MRNVLCPRYRTCLDLAARRDRHFDCGRCRLRRVTPGEFEQRLSLWHDLDGCHLLLLAIYYPEEYAEWVCDRVIEATRERSEMGAWDRTGRGVIVDPGASP